MINNLKFHFTPAVILASIGAAITLGVTFGLHVNKAQSDAIMQFAGIILSGVVVGGGLKSAGMFIAGVHPAMLKKGVRHATPKHVTPVAPMEPVSTP